VLDDIDKFEADVQIDSTGEAGNIAGGTDHHKKEHIGSESSNAAFGKENESPPLTFLRGSSVLLKPGQIESRLVFSYQPIKSSYYGTSQSRYFSSTLGVSLGLHERLESWINLPFAYARAREDSFFNQDREDEFGLRDISFGTNILVLPESVDWPEFNMALGVSAPTGRGPYDIDKTIQFGSGHWLTEVGLNFVRSVDPAIVFGGVSGGFIWPHEQDGRKFEYGWKYDYHMGIGFAINDKLTLSSTFQGGYRPPLIADGDTYGAFSTDPMSLSLGFGYRLAHMTILEPSIRFGINDDANNNTAVSLGVSKRFD